MNALIKNCLPYATHIRRYICFCIKLGNYNYITWKKNDI